MIGAENTVELKQKCAVIGKALLEQLLWVLVVLIPKGTTVKGPDGDEYTWMGAPGKTKELAEWLQKI